MQRNVNSNSTNSIATKTKLFLRSLVKFKMKITNNTLQPSEFSEQLLKLVNQPKKVTSHIYKLISTSNCSITLPKTKWENDLALSPDPNFWTQICSNIFAMTTNTNLQLIQYKTIHRTHFTRSIKLDLLTLTPAHNAQGTRTPISTPPGTANPFTRFGPLLLRRYPPSWTAESPCLRHFAS